MSDDSNQDRGFATRAIHVGQEPDQATGAVIPPLHATSTFIQYELGQPAPYIYSRSANPTRVALERNLAALEGGEHGIAFASGCAAIDAVIRLLSPGDHVIAPADLYGGTFRLFEQVIRDWGIDFDYVDTSDLGLIRDACRPETRMLYLESPTNPLMTLVDLAGAAEIARELEALVVVDNTFMSPYFQRPLEHGTDVVLHSTTKYINGHSDSIGGVAVTDDDAIAERLRFVAKSAGAALSPFEAWLIQRGVKTLALRMERSDANAREIAAFLDGHDKVGRVYYPGLSSHPQHELARRQMSGFGGMLSFELDDFAACKRMLDAVRVCTLAESLGGVETLISHPPSMTHASIPAEERARRGIRDGLIRISVGVEDLDDLLADLEGALAEV